MEECIICLEHINTEQPGIILPCLHRFHSVCINEWFIKSGKRECPTCRTACPKPEKPKPKKTVKYIDYYKPISIPLHNGSHFLI